MSMSGKAVLTQTGVGRAQQSYPCAGGASIQCTVTGTATYSIQWSNDGVNFIEHETIAGATSDAQGSFLVPVVTVAVEITSGTGTVDVDLKGSTNQ